MTSQSSGLELHYQGEERTGVEVLLRLIGTADTIWLFAEAADRENLFEAIMAGGAADVLLAEARHLPKLARAARQCLEDFGDVKSGEFERFEFTEEEPRPLGSIVAEIASRLQQVIAGLLLVCADAATDATAIDRALAAIRRGEAVPSLDGCSVLAVRPAGAAFVRAGGAA
jgi:hypothetical protein